jgi:hypothetical protein
MTDLKNLKEFCERKKYDDRDYYILESFIKKLCDRDISNSNEPLCIYKENGAELSIGTHVFDYKKYDLVIDMTDEVWGKKYLNVIQIPLSDSDADVPFLQVRCDLVNIILKYCMTHGRRVLVHCYAGKSRSFTVLFYYLYVNKKMDFFEIFNTFISKDWKICPNIYYIKFIIDLYLTA